MDDDSAELLAELGLSNYEARAYVTLAEHGAMTADDLAAESGVPRGRVYDVLNGLVDRALVRADDGRPRTYTHVEPTAAVDRLLERRVDELEQRRTSYEHVADRAETTLSALAPDHDGGEGFATSALGDEAARDLLDERFAAADASVRVVVQSLDVGPELRSAAVARIEQLLERGVEVRLLATDFANATETLERLVDDGLEVRVAERVPPQRFILFDDQEVCLEVVNPAADDELLAVVDFRDVDLAASLGRSFDDLWERAAAWNPGGD
ncbi:TrmB family transcriptional regulator [Natrarchaeobaculum aegyptiacum]|uniref:TrmB family transcriptional regulator n=1 Tax=Natrarchaeobaculum aegyptiacum TaxID=745377 RepID=A0A2Z2HUM2_9EURY|nr:helix-turn-helix domain-containing protein [Natrarchaeobaculum aegyptiacum]ARS90483.1 TrmB family transcriptional regulator [Natrarchaeobaculum aegyptiacum]